MTEFHILLIDDDEDDFLHIRDLLNDVMSSKYKVTWKSNYNDGRIALNEQTFDACLLDYRLGEKTGLELLSESRGKMFSCPIIFLTGLIDFELDIKAMHVGASDYLVKGQLTSPLLERSIRYAIKQRHDMEELRESKAQIIQQDRLASLGLLASSLAHEIGTPMGIIRSRAELAESKAGSNEALKKDLATIVTQIDRITKLVNSLLHLAREQKSETGASVDINQVIQDVLNLIEHELERNNINLIKKLSAANMVKAEAGPLGQVLLNILINAIHAIDESRKQGMTRPHDVIIRTELKNDEVVLSVKDTGCGISDENQRNLFKPFFTTKEIGQGTGLGLATSFKIVESWGGHISATSKLGEGSEFVIRLPLLN
tara:strand:+ start:15964 stop:17079 length:1116 start_codon:yes stop_codon:yes gene_type:complete